MCRTEWGILLSSGGDRSVLPASRDQYSTFFESQASPLHHVSRPFNWSSFTPLDWKSAGLSSPGQYFHYVSVVYACIPVTRLQTNVFHLPELLPIQLRTTIASVHNVAFLMSSPVSRQKHCSRLSPTNSARSSNRGKVIFFTGASLFYCRLVSL